MKTKRYVLGFDAKCGVCAEISERVQIACDGALETDELSAEIFEIARRDLLRDHRWMPILVELDDDIPVAAWSGVVLPPKLGYILGPKKSLAVINALGQYSLEQNDEMQREGSSRNVSRSTFVRLSAGLAFTAAIVGGGTAPAYADSSRRLIATKDSVKVTNSILNNEDLKQLLEPSELSALSRRVENQTFASLRRLAPQSETQFALPYIGQSVMESPDEGVFDRTVIALSKTSIVMLDVYREPKYGLKSSGELIAVERDGSDAKPIAYSFNGEIGDPLPTSLTEAQAAKKCGPCSKRSTFRVSKCKWRFKECGKTAWACVACRAVPSWWKIPCVLLFCPDVFKKCCKKTGGSYCTQCHIK